VSGAVCYTLNIKRIYIRGLLRYSGWRSHLHRDVAASATGRLQKASHVMAQRRNAGQRSEQNVQQRSNRPASEVLDIRKDLTSGNS
jgi:hypothetical protein